MDQDIQKVFELAAAVYRVAKLLPEGEVLVIKIKELALDILADFIRNDLDKTNNKVEVLQRFFKLVRLQGWVSSTNFDILEKEYQELADNTLPRPQFPPEKYRKVEGSTAPITERLLPSKRGALTPRQEQILRFLATKKEFRLKEIRKSFSKISDKTLRNDLKALVNLKYLRREGQGAGSVYAVIR